MNSPGCSAIMRSACLALAEEFCRQPTIWLEERHLHNRFAQLLRVAATDLPDVVPTLGGVPFPTLLNEYATINHYRRDDGFVRALHLYGRRKTGEDRGWTSGSVDFALLDPAWLAKHPYTVAVNKDARVRFYISRTESAARYLAMAEVKHFHFAQLCKKYDLHGHNPSAASRGALLRKMRAAARADLNKLRHEGAPVQCLLIANSELALTRDEVQAWLAEITAPGDAQLSIWYMQGGYLTRFNRDDAWYVERQVE